MNIRTARAAAIAVAALSASALTAAPASALTAAPASALTALPASALTAVAALAASSSPWRATGAPVFVQTDATGGNAVIAYDRAPDGPLTKAGTYATGGNGGILDDSVVDHLASEGSLTYDAVHRLLYAVNAGSDTITVFAVHGARLDRRQVIASGGRFPVSVTAHGDLVYVLNALDGSFRESTSLSG